MTKLSGLVLIAALACSGVANAQLAFLSLDETQVTDTGLSHLASLRSLSLISVTGTLVTPEGIDRLKQTLPNVSIHRDTSIVAQPATVASKATAPSALA